jgi:hypothetical protein
MFKRVKWNNLTNKKYLIHTHYYKASMKFTGVFSHMYENRIYFSNVKCYNIYKQNIGSIFFTKLDIYYERVSVKEKIQNAMEERALQKILQKITGDANFKW